MMKTIIFICLLSLAVGAQSMGYSANWKQTVQEVSFETKDGAVIKHVKALYIDIELKQPVNIDTLWIHTELRGLKNHWEAHGINSVYKTEKGFRVYIYYRSGITDINALAWGWKLYWKILN